MFTSPFEFNYNHFSDYTFEIAQIIGNIQIENISNNFLD